MRTALAALVLCLAPVALAQPGTLVVEGTAEVDAPPDVASITIGIQTEGRNPEETFREHESEVARVLQAVRQFGVPDRDIEIRQLSFNRSGRDVRAFRLVHVRTDSLRIVPELVAAVVGASGDIRNVQYGLSDPDRFADQALEAAVLRAREKAELMAAPLGVQVGPVRAVLESGIRPSVAETVQRGGRASQVQSYVDGVRVEGGAYATGSETVSARVVIEFDLSTL